MAADFADEEASLTEAFPRGYCLLVDQLNRAALSGAAKVAGGGKRRFHQIGSTKFFQNDTWLSTGVCSALGNRPDPADGDQWTGGPEGLIPGMS